MPKIIKLRGPIRELTVAVKAYSRGGGAFSRGPIQEFTIVENISFFKDLIQ